MTDQEKRILDAKEKEREQVMQLANKNKGMIEVDRYAGAKWDVDTDYAVSELLFDTLLVHFEDGDEDHKKKGGIYVPAGLTEGSKMWRTGKVLIAGNGALSVKVGDYVVFPGDKGINAKAVNIKGVGIVPHCIFIAEDRIFGICEKTNNE